MIRLLIADDHAVVRAGLRQLFVLAPDIQVVAEAVCGAEVLSCLRHCSVDLLLLDINMPGISGADLVARVKAHWPHVPILVFSMHNEAQVAVRMLRAGVGGFISKDCEPDSLLTAVRKVAAHGNYLAPDLAERIAFEVTSSSVSAPHTLLSQREADVFRLLIQGLGVTDIAAQLAISGKTVSTHKARLLEKLNLSNMADVMRYAMQHKLLG
ncbi:response regulator transcription factor [Rhodoferax sp. U11-2br]|uniref:response regulator n=1 Tax=Rhodoferax sp. U11-2br TaxID=2838878 RepID=UPI001BEA3538|nr:response regulator transcription factor [Rhodoferax sp. U11-2br]MBT3066255.1 response regulator transcription factor [Rhodoferax sp. U11-2br]